MKKIKLYVIVLVGALLIVLAAALIVQLVYHFPYTAVVMGAFVCGAIMLLILKCFTIQLAPRYAAEKRLEKFIRAGGEAHIAYFVNSEDKEASPDFSFSTTIQRHNGLKMLEFWGIRPETVIDKATAANGAEMDVYCYRNGRQYIGFTGTLIIVHDTEPYIFQIAVHTVSLCDREQEFSVVDR